MSDERSTKIQDLRRLAAHFREKARATSLPEYIDLMLRSAVELEQAADEMEADKRYARCA